MKNWMKIKTAGLPRWAWVAMLSGAVGLGLYLRSRSGVEIEGEENELGESYELGTGSEGLSAAGLMGPGAGQVIPVQAPYLPEGFVDMFQALTNLSAELGAVLGGVRETEMLATEGMTGGGAPEEPTEHLAPAPGPAKQCPQGTINHLRGLRGERQRLQNEINGMQSRIASLTKQIQQNPKAKQKGQWQSERNRLRGSIAHKRSRVVALNAAITRARAKPGCGSA
jgi:hypothetical protein